MAGTAGGRLATVTDESSKRSQVGNIPLFEVNSLSMGPGEILDFVNKTPLQN